MAKEKSNNHKRIGKKNPLKVLTCPEDFLAAEKWLLKFYSLKDDESLCEEEKAAEWGVKAREYER